MSKILLFVALLWLYTYSTVAAAPGDQDAKKFTTGYELLKQ